MAVLIFVEDIRKLTIKFICLFQFRFSNTVYYFLTIHLFYSTNPLPLHLYTEPRLMFYTEDKTYRKKEKKAKLGSHENDSRTSRPLTNSAPSKLGH